MTERNDIIDMIAMVSEVVAAYVSNNEMKKEELPNFINLVHQSLSNAGRNQSYNLRAATTPAVSIEDSIKPDYLVCLEDGRKLKMLKRHLKTTYNMTPDQYRERWGLPSSYPMVAPNYSKQRTKIAKSVGLGTRPKNKKRLAA